MTTSILDDDDLFSGAAPPAPSSPPVPTPPAAEGLPAGVSLRRFDDFGAVRTGIYDGVLQALQNDPGTSNERFTLRLVSPQYIDPAVRTKREQKEAVLGGRSLGRRIRGTWELRDNATGAIAASRTAIVGSVPHLTDLGTFVHAGTDYGLRNQQRLDPGAFTRRKDNGELEVHVNTLPGKGLSHRYLLDPEKQVFKIQIGQSEMPMVPLLRAMGATPRQLQEAWGPEVAAANLARDDASALRKLQQRVLRASDLGDDETARQALVRRFEGMELDPEVTRRTLGRPHSGLTLDALLDVTRRLIAVSRGEAEPDDRDALAYQRLLGPEDLFRERIERDSGRIRRQLLWKATQKGNLDAIPSSALTPQLEDALLRSGLGMQLEEINNAELLDRAFSVTRLGEGGIPSVEGIPDEARSVQSSQAGYIDPVRTPESMRAGVDLYLAANARKGSDGRLYAQMKDVRTGRTVWRTPRDLADSVITFPGALEENQPVVTALVGNRMDQVDRDEVDSVLPDAAGGLLSPLANMVPMLSSSNAQRMAMAGRMLTQALPLAEPQAPLVQSRMPGDADRSFEEEYSDRMGALRAARGGQVLDVGRDGIKVRWDDGRQELLDLYDHHPYNRKSFLHQTPLVSPGQSFGPGDLLARSNYTDERGTTALGRNARTAYMAWKGSNFEDAIVVSQAFADRFRAESMYQHDLDVDDSTLTGLRRWRALWPQKFDRHVLENLDESGVVRPGTVVRQGQPLILAARRREQLHGRVHRQRQPGWSDASVTWDHEDPGVVVDVVQGKRGPTVVVKSVQPMRVGDKMSNRYGGKGVVGEIVPDELMPRDSEGRPFEVLLNPLGIISRGNPSQYIETALGKIAERTGRPFKTLNDDPQVPDRTEWALEQLRQHGLSDTEDVEDPERERRIPGIFTGTQYFLRLHHLAEGKGDARGGGSYSAEDSPAKGGGPGGGAKRVAMLSTNALLSHGAYETLRDVGAVRGQRNDDYWYRFMSGYDPPSAKVPMAYEKFVDQLRASGVNVRREGSRTHVMALTDRDVAELAGDREIANGETVDWGRGMRPVPGGLFDPRLTGGPGGRQWSAIRLEEPLPNPVMEDPIRRVLGLTRPQFEEVLAGRRRLPRHGSGPAAVAQALDAMDLDRELETARAQIRLGNRTEKDQAIRRLGYLKSAKQLGLHPRDWVLSRVPVLPPAFRPVSQIGKGVPLVSDANFLYRDLLAANDNLREMRQHVEDVGDERLALYHAFKAVTGLGDPVGKKSQDKQVHGILRQVFGSSSKFGTVQRKLLSTTVDNVGRAVITPDPGLDMDSVGLPEATAFDVYSKFVARRLTRQGLPLSRALQEIRDKSDLARKALLSEMDERPVYIDRAPVLHRFGIMAFRPKLAAGHTMRISPLVVKGFNADFDGDAMNFHVPTSQREIREALDRMLPSKSLLSPATFRTPVHVPGQEYAGGLYTATSPDHASQRRPRTFATLADLKAAYARGDVDLNDRVSVLEH